MEAEQPPLSTIVGAFDAKTHLAALLDRVEAGEVVTITRHGKVVARLVPATAPVPDLAQQVDRLESAIQIGRAHV